jgi:hypothetical protein
MVKTVHTLQLKLVQKLQEIFCVVCMMGVNIPRSVCMMHCKERFGSSRAVVLFFLYNANVYAQHCFNGRRFELYATSRTS